MSKECTTHHHACDCRENKFKELEQNCMQKDARIKELEAESKRQSAIINHIKESGTMGDIYCGDKSPFANGWYSVIEFIELATRGEI